MTRNEVHEALKEVLQSELGSEEPILATDTLKILGVDSLDYIDFILAIEDRLFIELDEDETDRHINPESSTIAQIGAFLADQMGAE